MRQDDLEFARALAPMSVASFLDTYWERRPLCVSRTDPQFYDWLFALSDLDVMLAQSRPRYPQLRVVGKDRPSPNGELLMAGWASPVWAGLSPDDHVGYLYGAYSAGYTIIVELERLWNTVSRLARDIEETLHHKATAEMYLTPSGAQGFDLHFDHHDVFLLQLEGAKRWQVYEPIKPLPISEDRIDVHDDLGEPHLDVTLQAGDLLYMPRGWPHQGFTSDKFSLHITFGVFVYRWKDLLDEAVKEFAERDVRLRESVPIGFMRPDADRVAIGRQTRELLEILHGGHDADAALDQLRTRFLRRLQPVADGHFRDVDRLSELTLDSMVRKRSATLCRVSDANGTATIMFPGGSVGGPEWLAPVLRFVRDQEAGFRVASLPDVLDEQGKLVLVRRLVREGLLRIEEPEAQLT